MACTEVMSADFPWIDMVRCPESDGRDIGRWAPREPCSIRRYRERMAVLVERQRELDTLMAAVHAVQRSGRGGVALVSGEAGSGKTALIEALLGSLPDDVRSMRGQCDPASIARPFGPLADWLADVGEPGFGPSGSSSDRAEAFRTAHDLIAERPTLAVIEDAHWADDATIDMIGHLARRMERVPALLVVTFRSEEVVTTHPLTRQLGEIPAAKVLRVPIGPLTVEGVRALVADSDLDPVALHGRTGGNAFFVTESLATPERLSDSVRTAVLGRAARLAEGPRRALEALSVVPGRVDPWAVSRLANDEDVDQCVHAGVLVSDGVAVRFRHELAREVILGDLPPGRRRALHRAALMVFEESDAGRPDHARCAHHAHAAGDGHALLLHGPLAASAAERAGSQREAIAHLTAVIEHVDGLEPSVKLALLSRAASASDAAGLHEEAIVSFEAARRLAIELGDSLLEGEMTVRCVSPLTMSGRIGDAVKGVSAAIDILEALPPSSALALAYAQQCTVLMLSRQLDGAARWASRAIDLAESLGDDEVLSFALIQGGIAAWMAGEDAGLAMTQRGIDLAGARGMTRLVALGLSQIGSGGGEIRRYDAAVPALEQCIAFADEHELGSRGSYAKAWRARCAVELGDWDRATVMLTELVRMRSTDGVARMTALVDIGRLRARRGDPDPMQTLDEALAFARRTGQLQRLWPVAVARAEAAWLRGDLASEMSLVREVAELAEGLDSPWAIGDLRRWLARGGDLVVPGGSAPFRLLLEGAVDRAADEWLRLGCTYEAADALSFGSDEQQLVALGLFRELGATASARRLADTRRAAGLRVPRGAYAASRGNPLGLTARELEVVRLIAAGRTNAEIGTALFISTKTAGHHVSRMLTKLGARSRSEAVALCADAGIDLRA